jgi:hypothetical protein
MSTLIGIGLLTAGAAMADAGEWKLVRGDEFDYVRAYQRSQGKK